MSKPEVNWKGVSGELYGFWIRKIGSSFKDEPGNYIYAKKNHHDRWVAVYIGQTSSLKDRLATHEKEQCALRMGATHIHAHTHLTSEQIRRSEALDLIKNYLPRCNELHN